MGPLAGLKIIEMKSIGPVPYAGMLLADMGAEVVVVERSRQAAGLAAPSAEDVRSRGKKSIVIDLKKPGGASTLLKLVRRADALIEGYRPGVAERLGFGPEACFEVNERLVYGRLTGWGQTGPLAKAAGHDINFIALTGVLAAIGDEDRPVLPLNLIGDFAGGSLFLVMGLLAALLEAKQSGKGQVVDAAITDGSANLMSMFYGMLESGRWTTRRNDNLLDGAAYHYNVYETKDGRWVSVGPLEPGFYAVLVERAGLDPDTFGRQAPAEDWAELKSKLAAVFRRKDRKEWCEILEGTDACFAPVLDLEEAPGHRHNQARRTYIDIDGVLQAAPAPRFSRNNCNDPEAPHAEGDDTHAVLADWGVPEAEIETLRESGAVS